LIAPGTKRLKLKYDKLLSSFSFKFNLRRYMTGNPSISLYSLASNGGNTIDLVRRRRLKPVFASTE